MAENNQAEGAAALDEHVVPANVKLPDFWADTPATWFTRAESVSRTNRMPASIRPLLVSNSVASLADMALQADNLLTFHRAQPTTVAAASSTTDTALAELPGSKNGQAGSRQ
jgi:hypothetical protein